MSKIVTDAAGRRHVFPDAATPEMIAQAMGIGLSDKFKTYSTNRLPPPAMAANVQRGTAEANAITRAGLTTGLAQIDPQTGRPNWFQKVRDVTDVAYRPLTEGATLSLGDEARALGAGVAGAMNGEGFQREYDKALASERGAAATVAAEHPVSSFILRVVGSLGTGMGAKGAAANLTARETIKQGAKVGAGFGAVAGFGSGEGTQDRLTGGAIGGAAGGALGALIPTIGVGISKLISRWGKTPAIAPTVEMLKADSKEAYKLAEDANLVISQGAVKRFTDTLATDLRKQGYSAKIHTKTAGALDELTEAAQKELPFQDFEILRRIVSAARNSNDRDEVRVAGILADKMDDFLANLKPADIVSGDAAQASRAVTAARELWSRARKGELVDEAILKGGLNAETSGSGGNIDNALRQQFKALLTNKTLRNRWTPEERAMLQQAAGGTVTRGLLRWMGKLSPEGNGLMLGLQTGAAMYSGGTTAPLMVLGAAAKRTSDAMTKAAATRAQQAITSGVMPPVTMVGPAAQSGFRSLSAAAGANIGSKKQRRGFADLME